MISDTGSTYWYASLSSKGLEVSARYKKRRLKPQECYQANVSMILNNDALSDCHYLFIVPCASPPEHQDTVAYQFFCWEIHQKTICPSEYLYFDTRG